MLSERLKELRQFNKMTQEDVALAIGVSKNTISNYETKYSTPDNELLIKLADLFDVSVDYLLGRTMIKKSDDPGFISIAAHALDNLSEDDQKELLEYAKILKKKRDSLNGK